MLTVPSEFVFTLSNPCSSCLISPVSRSPLISQMISVLSLAHALLQSITAKSTNRRRIDVDAPMDLFIFTWNLFPDAVRANNESLRPAIRPTLR
jgi:hypothetical protein